MPLLDAVLSLSEAPARDEALQRILRELARVTAADALSVLTAADDGAVTVAAQIGLSPAARGLCFRPAEHPRLRRATLAAGPIRFLDPSEPDPYSGWLLGNAGAIHPIHACMAVPLRVQDRLAGLLTLDACDPHGLRDLRDEDARVFAGLCAAALRLDAGPSPAPETRRLLAPAPGAPAVPGRSAGMQRIEREIAVLAPLSVPVLVTGETGVGKELVARALHERSPRASRPLVVVNCAAIPAQLVESELFGHKKGAFTGATAARAGRFEAARGGTVFLDEVGELPLAAQAQLLRVLQEGEIQPVGDDRAHRVEARVVAATNRDLRREVEEGRFRADLFHRLWVYPICVPPLRERREDIPALCERFAAGLAAELGARRVDFTDAALHALAQRAWPGNVRELKHAVERAVLRRMVAGEGAAGRSLVLRLEDLDPGADARSSAPQAEAIGPPQPLPDPSPPRRVETLAETLERARREAFARAFQAASGNAAVAGRLLGLSRSFAYKEAVRLGLLPGPAPRRR
ncbi:MULTISPECIES: nitric oxide reductase transcriptional regulator NorR [Sorangium]|uniref:Transcriptional regulator n=1 Tax=Sorangium cellulosum TaxID=56 RepID=A0A4P2QWD9_SORCE|nr:MULTISPECIES: nitric oxide reductase transcriptional regulator NorR [Sorangium]AUX34461.1 transcriptional regulator [Sorangium cellulosum]WCQ93775.1 Regulatory protein LuxO [Sorangium sp. Soce836]